jgi:hypothetical protein
MTVTTSLRTELNSVRVLTNPEIMPVTSPSTAVPLTSPERILREAQASNVALVSRVSKADKSYNGIWKNYVKWLQVESGLGVTQPPYLTRDNISHWFSRVVAKKKVVKNTCTRYINALQWYADHHATEHAGKSPRFIVRDGMVGHACDAQQAYLKAEGGKLGVDPHRGLKDVLSLPVRLRILNYIYSERTADWGPAAVNFTWGLNVAVRGHSNRKMTYCDLNMSSGFGAEEDGPLSRALLLVLRKGDVHKDRKDKDNQLACWRHKHFELCSVFATAIHVVWSLAQNETINFFHDDKNARADWWDLPLIDWDTYSETANSTKAIFENTRTTSCKVTHLRTTCLQMAGFEGLHPHQINTLTKHILEKMYSAYQSICEKEVSHQQSSTVQLQDKTQLTFLHARS